MQGQLPESTPSISHLVRVRAEASGQFTAEVVGLPEIRATASTREEALGLVRTTLGQWLASGQLVAIEGSQQGPSLPCPGWAKDDPLYREFLDDLERFRQEDLEQTQREYEQECSDTSSTQTT